MKIEKFEDIEAWREARILVKNMYEVLRGCGDFGFKGQIQRACISIMSNIAEGFLPSQQQRIYSVSNYFQRVMRRGQELAVCWF